MAVLVVLASVLWIPTTASAHAAVVSSEPEAGERLGTAPGVVVLRFTEPLNPKLSRAVVIDPTGRRFDGRASGSAQIRIPLSTNAPGIYEVEWTSVSVVDGHTLRGSFEFGVGVTPGASEAVVGSSPTGADLAISVARTVEYVALLLSLGMLLLRRLARDGGELLWVRPRLGVALGVALVAGIAVVLGEGLAAAPDPSASALLTYLTTGLPGLARVARMVLEAMAIAAVALGTRGAWVFVGSSVIALAAAGHAAAIRPQWWGVTVNAIHLLAAGLWAGGILALATLRPPAGWRGEPARSLLRRFSPIALKAFALTAAFGAIQAVQELGHLDAIVTSSYGWTLLVKIALVGLMVTLSLAAWRSRRARPRVEAGLAILAIGAAALLAAYPLPPSRLGTAEEAEAARPLIGPSAPGDLTLGGHSGPVLVGLTVHPAQPGRNELTFYVLPLEGEEAAASVQAQVMVDGEPYRVERCGDTCRRAVSTLRGGEQVSLRVPGPKGGVVSFDLPALPTQDGTSLLSRVQERMHRLRTYRLDESLSSGLATIRSTYEYQAPGRLRVRVSDATDTIWIGPTRYKRDLPHGEWEISRGAPGIEVPSFIWDYFEPFRNPRILGKEEVRGIPTTVLAFAGGKSGIAVWFRLWVDRSGLVRQAEMRAPGHFMDHRYFDFDGPVDIRPPTR